MNHTRIRNCLYPNVRTCPHISSVKYEQAHSLTHDHVSTRGHRDSPRRAVPSPLCPSRSTARVSSPSAPRPASARPSRRVRACTHTHAFTIMHSPAVQRSLGPHGPGVSAVGHRRPVHQSTPFSLVSPGCIGLCLYCIMDDE